MIRQKQFHMWQRWKKQWLQQHRNKPNNGDVGNKKRCAIITIYRRILKLLITAISKQTLNCFLYFRFPVVSGIFLKKCDYRKHGKQETLRPWDDNEIKFKIFSLPNVDPLIAGKLQVPSIEPWKTSQVTSQAPCSRSRIFTFSCLYDDYKLMCCFDVL
jgi:hypothetical protein